MIKLIMKLATNVFALLVVEYLVPGFELDGIQAAIVAAVVIGLINTFIRPVLQFIALPISLLTLGIAAFLINVVLLWAVAYVVPGFEISSFLTAAIASVLLALINIFLHKLSS